MRTERAAAVVIVVGVALSIGGCSAKKSEPRGSSSGVLTLVAGPPSAYRAIVVSGPAGDVELTADLHDAAVPLRAARAFTKPQSLVEYGLDQPQGRLRYQPASGGKPIELAIGAPTFDARGIYLSQQGDSRVFLVFVDRLRPVLAAGGISVPVPVAREPADP